MLHCRPRRRGSLCVWLLAVIVLCQSCVLVSLLLGRRGATGPTGEGSNAAVFVRQHHGHGRDLASNADDGSDDGVVKSSQVMLLWGNRQHSNDSNDSNDKGTVKDGGHDGRIDSAANADVHPHQTWLEESHHDHRAAKGDARSHHRRAAQHAGTLEDSNTFFPNVKLAIGIPTANRSESYAEATVQSLLQDIAAHETSVKCFVQQSVSAHGLVEQRRQLKQLGAQVIAAPSAYTPLAQGATIPNTLGDKEDRVRWRAHHALDYAHLLRYLYDHTNAPYLLVMEDDVQPARHMAKLLLRDLDEHANVVSTFGYLTLYNSDTNLRVADWTQHFTPLDKNLFCGTCGAVALLFRRSSVPALVHFIQLHVFDYPVDALVAAFFIQEQPSLRVYERVPNLVQHIGHVSTFQGNGKERLAFKSMTFQRDERDVRSLAAPTNEFSYIGCFKDAIKERDLLGLFDQNGVHNTPGKCAKFCKNYLFFAMQYTYECYCGNEFGTHGKVAEQECATTCWQIDVECPLPCGGVLANAVYRTGLAFDRSASNMTVDWAATDANRNRLATVFSAAGRCE
eukprot:m.83791 g.83791  ORF g.83791 m.83791 type:complete len:565 (-) comp14776_c0_seq1:337-2031(-)